MNYELQQVDWNSVLVKDSVQDSSSQLHAIFSASLLRKLGHSTLPHLNPSQRQVLNLPTPKG